MSTEFAVRNRAVLEEIFGAWPSFHDAEVISARLDRGDSRAAGPGRSAAQLEVDVHIFETTSEVDAGGYNRQQKHTRVTLLFTGIDELSLEGFNNQNVLFDMILTDISDRNLDQMRWEVSFESSYGLAAGFLCGEIAIASVAPYESPHGGGGSDYVLPT